MVSSYRVTILGFNSVRIRALRSDVFHVGEVHLSFTNVPFVRPLSVGDWAESHANQVLHF